MSSFQATAQQGHTQDFSTEGGTKSGKALANVSVMNT